MTKVCVRGFTISLDGYGAGPRQSMEEPLGARGEELHGWLVGTRTFRERMGQEGGTTGLDDEIARSMLKGIGAGLMGRNMFGPPQGGPWEGDAWKGWWGDEPPYHGPVFVLTHHEREPQEMLGGTTFHFVTGGLQEALERARAAAGEQDVLVNGGVSIIRQLLAERAIDELELAIAPILLGEGEHLFAGLGPAVASAYRCVAVRPTDEATHVRLVRS